MGTKKIIEEYKKKGYLGVRSNTVYSGRRRVDLITAEAKTRTPLQQISLLTSRKTKRVHIGTYVPSTKKTFGPMPMIKYAKRRRKK